MFLLDLINSAKDAVISPIANGISNLVSGGTWQQSGGEIAAQKWQEQQAQQANFWSAQEAQKNRDYQTDMSNTAYQRGVEDLKAAGLNPAMVYSAGGASSPSGSSGSAFMASAVPVHSISKVDNKRIEMAQTAIRAGAMIINSML